MYSPVGPGIGGSGMVRKCPGVGMAVPATTGPTGEKGGTKLGTGPIPSTSITSVRGLYIWKTIMNALAMESNNSEECAAMGFAKLPSMELFRVDGENCDSPGEAKAASGMGTLGVGGVAGPGNAAKAGYARVPVSPDCQDC